MNPLLKKLLAPTRMEYLTVNQDLLIQETSFGVGRFADRPEEVRAGFDVRDSFPELIGVEDILKEILLGRQASFELKGIARNSENSSPLYIDLWVTDCQDEEAQEPELAVWFEDVTEKMVLKQSLVQRANEAHLLLSALATSKNHIERIIDSMAEALIVTASSGKIKTVNRATLDLFGYREAELIGHHISLILAGERLFYRQPSGANAPQSLEVVCLTKTGEEILVAFSRSAIESEAEGVEDFVYIGRDITERKRTEAAVAQINAALAQRVEEQTAELKQTIQQLESEIGERRQTEAALRESEARLSSLMDSLQDVVWSISATNFEVFYLNPATETLYGRSVVEFHDNRHLWQEVIHPEDRAAIAHFIEIILETGSAETEYRIVRPDGEVRWVNHRGWLIGDNSGIETRIDGLITDISERKQAEVLLHQYQNQLEELVSEQTAELTETNEQLQLEIGARKRTEEELRFARDNLEVLVRCRTAELAAANAALQAEITERRLATAALQNIVAGTASVTGEEFFPALVRHLATALGVRYAAVCCLAAGSPQELLQTLALWAGDRLGENCSYSLAGTPCEAAIKEAKMCFYPDKLQELFPSDPIIHPLRAISYLGVPLINTSQKPIGLLCVLDDKPLLKDRRTESLVTVFAARAAAELERKWAQESLQSSRDELEIRVEERTAELVEINQLLQEEIAEGLRADLELQSFACELQDLYNNAPCGYHSLDESGTFIRVNDTELNWLGYARDQLIGKIKFSDLLTAESLPTFEESFLRLKDRGWVSDVELELVRADGTVLPALLSATAVRDANGNYLMSRSTLFDITERVQTESALRESQERFRSAFEYSAIGMALVGTDGRWLQVNRSLCEILGYSERELQAMTFQEITHPEDADVDLHYLRQALVGEISTYQIEKRYTHKKRRVVWVLVNVSRVQDSDGRLLYFVCQFQDITARKRTEEALQQSERRLRRQQAGLMALAKSQPLYTGDFSAALRDITQIAVNTLGVERVSVWLYSDDGSSLRCADLYDQNTRQHLQGFELAAADFPAYFQALVYGSIIAADDAHSDPRTREFSASYLTPLGITSMLDVPVRFGGRTVGVICHEHVGPPRRWGLEEENFASYLAYMTSLAMEARDRKQAESALQKSLALLQATFDSTADGILAVDSQGKINTFNRKFVEMWRLPEGIAASREESRALAFAFKQLKDPQAFLKKVKELYNRLDADSYDLLEFKDGRVFECYSQPQRQGENIFGRVWNFRDITERKRAEEEQQKFVSLVENSSDFIGMTTLSGKTLYLNEAGRKLVGLDSLPETLSKNLSEYYAPETWEQFLNVIIPTVVQSGHWEGEVALRHFQTGGPIDMQISMFVVRHPQTGEPMCYATVQRDITERKQAEAVETRLIASLQESENKYRSVVDSLKEVIFQRDERNCWTFLNPAWTEITGFTIEESLGEHFLDFVHPDDRAACLESFQALLSGEKDYVRHEIRYRTKDGGYRWMEAQKRLILAADGTRRTPPPNPLPASGEGEKILGTSGTLNDITDRKRIEEALEQERRQLRQIIANAPVAMAMFDTEMRYLAHSNQWLTDYCLEGQSLIGRSHYEVFPDIPAQWRGIHKRALKGEVLSKSEDLFQRGDGSKLYLRWAVQPWHTSESRIGGIVMVTQAINELVEAREAALEGSRMKSQFLANMSHEIRTPMNGVLGMAQLLRKTPLNPEQQDFVRTIEVSGQNLLTLINDILDFSKLEAGEMRLETLDFDLNTCLEEVTDLLATQAYGKGLELFAVADSNVPLALRGDAGRLRQVLVNLVGNAIKFTDSGEVAVLVSLAGGTAGGTPLLRGDDRLLTAIRFSVRDTGIGIAPADLEKLFQSFSQVDTSTTRKYGGTGLGLAICKQLVELMGGEMGVESVVGEGSSFWFTVTLELQETPAGPSAPVPVSCAGIRLLVADGSATNRQVVRSYCDSWGVRADEVENGEVALATVRRAATEGQPYDVAVVSADILGVNAALLGQLIQYEPVLAQTKWVLMTSIQGRDGAIQPQDLGFAGYLSKPVKPSKLLDCLMRVLSQSSAVCEKPFAVNPPVLTSPQGTGETPVLRGGETAGSQSQQRANLKTNLKILLVEDTPTNQKVALNQLKVLGYQADCVSNGQEALDRMAETDYDIVLMDCLMPVLDGYKTTQAIRFYEGEYRHTVVIAMTANAMKGEREKCLEAGMDDYISKPIELETLEAVLHRWASALRGGASVEIPSVSLSSAPAMLSPKQEGDRAPLSAAERGVGLGVTPDREKSGDLAEPVAGGDCPVDLQRLGELTRGDVEFQLELLQTFMEDAAMYLQGIESALQACDCVALSRRAHQLKGASAMVAVRTVPELAAQLESQANESRLEGAAELVARVGILLQEVKVFIENFN
ncbi:PAS domain S-box protein [Kamptonema formosum]|uniref:PAS domain S-box protein n=1 Tax=Kamptonema formosum TaxID=331992 RepID=UPI00034B34BC|nr:PAS domain S-box protein [Oscillatoria sp. PCC 10802]